MASKVKTGVRVIVGKLKSNVTSILINSGLKRESADVINERANMAEKRRKSDFDSVYGSINSLTIPDQIKSVENLISNFNMSYGVFSNGQYLTAPESYILNIALNLKSEEIYSGVHAEWSKDECKKGLSNVRALNSASYEEYQNALGRGVQMSRVIERAYAEKYPTSLECRK